MRAYLFLNIIFVSSRRVKTDCDISSTAKIDEGNIGQTDTFPWLGVLRVHLPDGGKDDIAITGVVLIKQEYALVNADDVAKIPHSIFLKDTRVMFMAATDVPWFCGAKSYSTHPEYGISTYSTIALLKLDVKATQGYPIRPICWPGESSLNIDKNLYVVGYTDENLILEKSIYKAVFVEKGLCDEFYDRARLSDKDRIPTHYTCTYSPTNKTPCIFDTGMLLVTNATNYFSLVGFGVHGPGCGAPARFIDLQPYYEWIRDLTTDKEKVTYDDYRRAKEPSNVPLHDTFKFLRQPIGKGAPESLPMEYELYPFKITAAGDYSITDVDDSSFFVHKFNETYEYYHNACFESRTLIYREYLELKSRFGMQGTANYKISLFDLDSTKFTCAKLSIDSKSRSEATIAYKMFIEVGREPGLSPQKTPTSLLKQIQVKESPFASHIPVALDQDKRYQVKILEEKGQEKFVPNYDLHVQFKFKDRAILKLEVFSSSRYQRNSNALSYMPPAMTAREERSQYLRRMRIKPTIKPSRKMWYDKFNNKIKSNIIDIKPDLFSNTYTDISEIALDSNNVESGVPVNIIKAAIHQSNTDKQPVRHAFDIPIPKISVYDDVYDTPVSSSFKIKAMSYKLQNSVETFDDVYSSSNHCISRYGIIHFLYITLFLFLY